MAVERIPREHANGNVRSDERIVHATDADVAIGLDTANFEIHVPEHITPGFATNICESTKEINDHVT